MRKFLETSKLLALVSEDKKETLFVTFKDKKDKTVIDVVSEDIYSLDLDKYGTYKETVTEVLILKNTGVYINGKLYNGMEAIKIPEIAECDLFGVITAIEVENVFYKINEVKAVEYTKDLVIKK